jgi:hypothetical protein
MRDTTRGGKLCAAYTSKHSFFNIFLDQKHRLRFDHQRHRGMASVDNHAHPRDYASRCLSAPS